MGVDASPQESVAESSSELGGEARGGDAGSCSGGGRPVGEETSRQSAGASDRRDGHSFSGLVLVVDGPAGVCWRGFSGRL